MNILDLFVGILGLLGIAVVGYFYGKEKDRRDNVVGADEDYRNSIRSSKNSSAKNEPLEVLIKPQRNNIMQLELASDLSLEKIE